MQFDKFLSNVWYMFSECIHVFSYIQQETESFMAAVLYV